jgi:hypothetical protein
LFLWRCTKPYQTIEATSAEGNSALDNHEIILQAFATALSAGGPNKWAGMLRIRDLYPRLTSQPLDETQLQRLVLRANTHRPDRETALRRVRGGTKQFCTDLYGATVDVAAATGPISDTCRTTLLDLADMFGTERDEAAAQIEQYRTVTHNGQKSPGPDPVSRSRQRPALRLVKT